MADKNDGGAAFLFKEIAEYIGELMGAATHDFKEASWEDVDMRGMSIKGWREAYCEGIKDLSDGILSRIPEHQQEQFKEIGKASFADALLQARAQGK